MATKTQDETACNCTPLALEERGMFPEILAEICDLAGEGVHARPRIQDGYVYAVDGRVAVRIRASELSAAALAILDHGKYSFADLFAPGPGTAIELPHLDLRTGSKCQICRGAGRVAACGECEGGAKVCPECGHETECEWCSGTGFRPAQTGRMCTNCSGVGKELPDKIALVGVNGYGIDGRYLALLSRHGVRQVVRSADESLLPYGFCVNVRVADPVAATTSSNVRAETIEGLIMPVKM